MPVLETFLERVVEELINAPLPNASEKASAFHLGACGYYCDFSLNRRQSPPVRRSCPQDKKQPPHLNTIKIAAFDVLKEALTSRPVLRAPDLQKQFVLRRDASVVSIGTVVQHEHDGVLHPVTYARRQLLLRESRYSGFERECVALVWAVEEFDNLHGMFFVIQTDRQLLKYLSKAGHLNSRVLRWSLALQERT